MRKMNSRRRKRCASATRMIAAMTTVCITSSQGERIPRQKMPNTNEVASSSPKSHARRCSSSQSWTKRLPAVSSAVCAGSGAPATASAGSTRLWPHPGQKRVPARTRRWQAGHSCPASGTRGTKRERGLDALDEECDDDELDDPALCERAWIADGGTHDQHEVSRGRDQDGGQR